MPNKYIITGGPGTGKTALVENLKDAGYSCYHEIARHVIKEQLIAGTDYLPWANLEKFSEIVVRKMIEDMKEVDSKIIHFFDRGIPDVIAYMNKANLSFSKWFYEQAETFRYNQNVFVAPPWKEIYTTDPERKETYEDAVELFEHLCSTYEGFGYNIVEIPKKTVNERMDFILNHL